MLGCMQNFHGSEWREPRMRDHLSVATAESCVILFPQMGILL